MSLSANEPQPNQADFLIEGRMGHLQRSQICNNSLSAQNIKILVSSGLVAA